MSTNLSDLQNQPPVELGEDNSEIVNEILNEMNGSSDVHLGDSDMRDLVSSEPLPGTSMGGTTLPPNQPNQPMSSQAVVDQTHHRQDINTNHVTRQMDPEINMMMQNDLNPQFAPVLSSPSKNPSNITLNIQNSSNYVDEITKRIQDPFLFVVVTLVMFSPMLQKTLARVLPRLFDTGPGLVQWLSVLLKSLFGSLLFVAAKNIL